MRIKEEIIKFNKKKLIFIICIFAILCVLIFLINKTQILKIFNINKQEEYTGFSFETKNYTVNNDYTITYTGIVVINELNGVEKISYSKDGEDMEIFCNGKNKVAIDYTANENQEYIFKVKPVNETEKKKILKIDRLTSGENSYELVKGIYVCTPNIEDGFNKDYTRYLEYNNGFLNPGNWITDEEPQNWYDYKNQVWANIYTECEGIENYYVWIPRYVYKLDQEDQRSDIKFVDVYNNYKNGETGEKLTAEQLVEQGYKLPEAFTFGDSDVITSISGYWMSKYQLSELEGFKLDYNLAASEDGLNVTNCTLKNGLSATQYTFSINGQIVNTTITPDNYMFTNVKVDKNIVNITALNENGEIVASMTKDLSPVEVNEPDLTGFDEDTTFYVYWDENGKEHNEIPISKSAPENWYNYTYSKWANIVTRNDGLENYYVWIPRYAYNLNQTSQRANIKFIKGIGTDAEPGYKIPEAFTWGDDGTTQLSGYWISKYQLSREEANPKISAELAAGSSLIRVRDITGTALKTKDTSGNEIDAYLRYEYYLNGEYKYAGTNSKENYVFSGLESGKTYVVTIIARDENNDYVGAITKKITTKEANEPDLTGFNPEVTYYVVYDNNGEMQIGDKILNPKPQNWYNYTNRIWANIAVITDGATNYFTWIPRYEYRILSSLSDWSERDKSNMRTDVNFLEGTSTETTPGYKIPEAFTWGDNGETQLTGYWISKYQLSNN